MVCEAAAVDDRLCLETTFEDATMRPGQSRALRDVAQE